ncbi:MULTISPECIES: hypothetical protein [Streptomyces]|uniref:hypothetical protein n=1 Tax=Streptomyces TaxID=1883 RepID=UPI0029ADC187|nr:MULTISPECIES: hypothetical protein [Streptomyces]MDX3363058.1 hypothetical protein [Streptomyces sp. ME02-6978.2a]WTI29603.1 hypothetical protein OHA67_26420 [Streptomyces jietaisiensis]
MIVVIAVLLLPVAGAMLAALSWWEERLFTAPEAPRHARAPRQHRHQNRHRHLRLIPGGRAARPVGTAGEAAAAHAEHRDAA